MLRATLIIFTAMFSVIILKMKLYRHHYLSLVLIMIGLVLVGLSQVFYPSPTSKEEVAGSDAAASMVIGVIVLLVG
jgi:drug/metabolite transporter (DMT)-like permease